MVVQLRLRAPVLEGDFESPGRGCAGIDKHIFQHVSNLQYTYRTGCTSRGAVLSCPVPSSPTPQSTSTPQQGMPLLQHGGSLKRVGRGPVLL